MYPYPSGDLHIGHWYIVTPTDALARFRRMHGYNVFFPIGFDAFGLPAENAAIKSGGHPFTWTMPNIENMRRQFRTMGATFDWDARGRHRRPVVLPLEPVDVPALPGAGPGLPRRCRRSTGAPTTGPWRASRSRAPTGAAGAAARWSRSATWSSGTCARPPTPTSCCDFSGIDWPEPIRIQQTNWIGRSEGAEIDFETAPSDAPSRAARRCACSRRGRTRCSGRRSWSSPRSTRSSPTLTAPETARRGRGVRRAGPPPDRDRPPVDRPREDRRRHRRRRHQPGQRRADPDLHRRLRAVRLRHRRDHGRARPRRARLRVRPAVRAADPARRRGPGHGGRRADGRRLHRPRRRRAPGQQRRVRRAAGRRGRQGDRREAGRARAGRAQGHLPAARLADQPPALLGHADPGRLLPDATASCPVPDEDLPVRLPETVDYQGSGDNPLNHDEAFLRHRPARAAAARRGARPTRWTRSSTRRGTGSATCRRTRTDGPVDPRDGR